MALLEWVGSLFGRRKTLEEIPLDDLRRERIGLEMSRDRLQREIAQLEERKQQLFRKGKDATSNRERTEVAQQIYDLEIAIQAKAKDQEMVHQRIRVLLGLIQLKERMHLIRQMKGGSVLIGLPLEEVTEYVDKIMVEDRLEMEKLAAMLEALEVAPELPVAKRVRPEILAIVAAMEEAKAAEEAGHPDPDAALKKVDQLFSEKAAESEQRGGT